VGSGSGSGSGLGSGRGAAQLEEEPLDLVEVEAVGRGRRLVGEARVHPGGQEAEADLVDGATRGRDLGHDLTALPVVGEHLLEAPDLPLDAAEPALEVGGDVVRQLHAARSEVWSDRSRATSDATSVPAGRL
jgi:hypothetical protein